MRGWESRLEVAAFDPSRFQAQQEQFAEGQIQIRTLAELANDSDRDRKLYELETELDQDVPTTDTLTPRPFEEWQKRSFENPWLLPDAWFIALDGDQYVGYSCLYRSQSGPRLETGLTGVLRPSRRRGIALALKLRALEYARAVGSPEIRTWNATTNQGMLAINGALGFVRQPAWIDYEKRLAPDE
jgi:GNAT superfamily N-acetyltransferase